MLRDYTTMQPRTAAVLHFSYLHVIWIKHIKIIPLLCKPKLADIVQGLIMSYI